MNDDCIHHLLSIYAYLSLWESVSQQLLTKLLESYLKHIPMYFDCPCSLKNVHELSVKAAGKETWHKVTRLNTDGPIIYDNNMCLSFIQLDIR